MVGEDLKMSDYKASHTALGTAYLRAAHQLLEAKPLLFDDPVALSLLGSDALQLIQNTAANYRTPKMLALRAHVVLRSRFTEDRLAAAVSRGITQYVILGAGFDTFALRQPSWAQILKIIEVDHSGTQTVKRSYIATAGLAMPENAVFADIDFEHESLLDGLLRYGVSMDEPTFFSWLGVTMYLKEDAIDAVLRSVAMFPAGSEIVLTFVQPSGNSPSPLSRRVANLGEPWVSCFEPDALETKLRVACFSKVEFLTPAKAEERYFRQRPRDLPVPKKINILCAVR
jgi:methyltransferase (TIGR00027 family)